MTELFENAFISSLELQNRFIRSATWEGLATDKGEVTKRLTDLMVGLAKGGIGLIISGHSYVQKVGQAGPWQLGAYDDNLIPGLEKMTNAVHEAGGLIIMQLAHAGCFAAGKLSGTTPVAVSAAEGLFEHPVKELSAADIQGIRDDFVSAAIRAKKAGFDGIQIHSAHGYLLSQFLSPHFNRRTDMYGGDIKERSRLHVEIIEGIRSETGKDFPILVKMNCSDFSPGGLEIEDALKAAVIFQDAGVDAIELSGGLLTGGKLSPTRPNIDSPEKEAYFKKEAARIKEAIDIPLILVGGIRSLEVAKRLVDDGTADFISLSRPLIREPGLVLRWQQGDVKKAACISDNLCFVPARKGSGIDCLTEKKGK